MGAAIFSPHGLGFCRAPDTEVYCSKDRRLPVKIYTLEVSSQAQVIEITGVIARGARKVDKMYGGGKSAKTPTSCAARAMKHPLSSGDLSEFADQSKVLEIFAMTFSGNDLVSERESEIEVIELLRQLLNGTSSLNLNKGGARLSKHPLGPKFGVYLLVFRNCTAAQRKRKAYTVTI